MVATEEQVRDGWEKTVGGSGDNGGDGGDTIPGNGGGRAKWWLAGGVVASSLLAVAGIAGYEYAVRGSDASHNLEVSMVAVGWPAKTFEVHDNAHEIEVKCISGDGSRFFNIPNPDKSNRSVTAYLYKKTELVDGHGNEMFDPAITKSENVPYEAMTDAGRIAMQDATAEACQQEAKNQKG